jgi:hypothetical protein
MKARRAHGSGHRFPPVTRQKLDRLTVKRTAKSEAREFSVDHGATFPKNAFGIVAIANGY